MESLMQAMQGLLTGIKGVLFDFDGPICDLFATTSSEGIAEGMRRYAESRPDLPALELERPDSPVHILDEAVRRWGRQEVDILEAMASAGESEAVKGALPTPYADRLVRQLFAHGLKVAIATNNSEGAVYDYLDTHSLAEYFGSHVYGRRAARGNRPIRLKPDPECIYRAMDAFDRIVPGDFVMVGDSLTDVEAARCAGARFLGFPNPHRGADELRQDPKLILAPSLDYVCDVWGKVFALGGRSDPGAFIPPE
jgi:beta-phosphoglucomutase-like phosphatase (HAD superfamily)